MTSAAASLDRFAADKLAQLDRKSLRRTPLVTQHHDAVRVERDGRMLINACSNDYLGLAHHPDVIEAAREAATRFGTGAGASRLVTGGHPLLFELEQRLAAFKGTEDCLLFGSGYLANLGIVPSLVGPRDMILADELSHACLLAGGGLSGAAMHRFRHNDMGHVRDLLDEHRARHPRCLILTDGVFSMDGDLGPLDELSALAGRFDAWLMSDDAHGIGVLHRHMLHFHLCIFRAHLRLCVKEPLDAISHLPSQPAVSRPRNVLGHHRPNGDSGNCQRIVIPSAIHYWN